MVTDPRGFSLIELMVVIVIMGIMMAIAAPSVTEWVASQRVRDAAGSIHSSLTRARSEARARGQATSVTPVTVSGVTEWKNGWYIEDPSRPGVFIEQNSAVPNATITGAGTITFTAVGRLSGTATGLKIIAAGTEAARCIRVDTAGRAKVTQIASSATCP